MIRDALVLQPPPRRANLLHVKGEGAEGDHELEAARRDVVLVAYTELRPGDPMLSSTLPADERTGKVSESEGNAMSNMGKRSRRNGSRYQIKEQLLCSPEEEN
jgi:hypothetical protein